MKKTIKSTLALAFCVVTIFATMIVAAAVGAPKAKVKSTAYNSVTISWAKVSGADAYQVERSTDGKKWTSLTSSTKSTSYTDSKLTTGKTYRYRVRAVDKGFFKTSYSSWSSQVKGTPTLGKVSSLKASSITYNSAKLTWKAVSGATGYQVQTYSGGAWKTYKTTTKTGMTVSSLTLGKSYKYRVRAYRTVSSKKLYGAVSAEVKVSPKLGTPASFTLKETGVSSAKFTWKEVSGATGYALQRYTSGAWKDYKTTTKTGMTVTDLTPGKSYKFRVRAYRTVSGKKIYSSTSSELTAKPVLKAPSSFTLSSTTYNSAKFTWKAASGAEGYSLERYTSGEWKVYKTTTSTSMTVTSLTPGNSYKFRVRAYVTVSGKKAYGTASSELTAKPVLKAPSYIKLSGISTTSLTLKWAAVDGAKGYELYNPSTKKWVDAGTACTLTVKSLKAGTKYAFKVRAYYGSYKAPESSSYSFTTTPATVSGVKVSSVTEKTVTFTWSKATGAAGYEPSIYNTETKKWTTLSSTTGTSATATGLTSSTSYKVRVRAYVNNSNVDGISAKTYGAYSSQISAKTALSAPVATVASSGEQTVTVSWKSVKGAASYIVEKLDANRNIWLTYDFDNKSWSSSENDSSTTELAFSENIIKSTAESYRVRAVDANGVKGAASNVVIGISGKLAVKVNTYNVTLTWPAVKDATKYTIYSRYPLTEAVATLTTKELTYNETNDTYSTNINFAPDSAVNLLIYGETSSGTVVVSSSVTFQTAPLTVVSSTSSSSYNASVNSQLLYLARAINSTKNYKGSITVNNYSLVDFQITSLTGSKNGEPLKILGKPVGANNAEEVKELFGLFELIIGEDLPQGTKEETRETLKFTSGSAVNEKGKSVTLRYYIEPTANKDKLAYVYNGFTSQTAWKNGFENITSSKNADGSFTIQATIKQELGSSPYHDGFIPSISSVGISATEGFALKNLKVGKSTLKAVIDADGILRSYEASSPFSTKLDASFTAEENSNGVKDGDNIGIMMGMEGKTAFNYTFTR